MKGCFGHFALKGRVVLTRDRLGHEQRCRSCLRNRCSREAGLQNLPHKYLTRLTPRGGDINKGSPVKTKLLINAKMLERKLLLDSFFNPFFSDQWNENNFPGCGIQCKTTGHTIFISILYHYQLIVLDDFGLLLVNYPTTEQLRYQLN